MADFSFDVDAALSEVPVNIMPLISDSDFKTIQASVAYNASGMALKWNFVTTAGAYTQTAVTPTTSGTYDWTNQGNGMYSIEIPASGGGSINNDTEGFGWFTGVADGVLPWRGPTICFRAAGLNDLLVDNAYSTTRGLAGTALPNAAAEASGGLYTRGTGAGQINQATNGQIDANAVRIDNVAWSTHASGMVPADLRNISGAAISTTTAQLGVNAVQISGSGTAADNAETAFTGGSYNVGGGAIVAASVTGAVGSVTGNVGGNLVGTIGGMSQAALADFFTVDSGETYADAVDGSVVKEIAVNSGGSGSDPWATALPGSYNAGEAGYIVGTFLDAAVTSRLAPTVASRTLDVTATGAAGIDWGNVENQSTSVNLSATNIDTDQVVATVTNMVTANVTQISGDATAADTLELFVEALDPATGQLDAGSFASGAFDAVWSVSARTLTAWSFQLPSNGLANITAWTVNITGNLSGSVGSVSGNVGGDVQGNVDGTVGSVADVTTIVDGVWDAPITDHLDPGSTGAALNAAGSAGDPWSTPLPGAYGAGTAGYIIGTNVDAPISDVPNALLTEADGVETGITVQQGLRVILAAAAGKANGFTGSPTDTVHYRNQADDLNRITANVDDKGNRTSVTLNTG